MVFKAGMLSGGGGVSERKGGVFLAMALVLTMVEVLKKERLKMKEDRRVLAMMISCRE
jgi:hypothetical protein